MTVRDGTDHLSIHTHWQYFYFFRTLDSNKLEPNHTRTQPETELDLYQLKLNSNSTRTYTRTQHLEQSMIASVKIDQPWCEKAPPKFSTSVSVKWANIRRKSAIKRENKHPTLFQSKAKKKLQFWQYFSSPFKSTAGP